VRVDLVHPGESVIPGRILLPNRVLPRCRQKSTRDRFC